MVSFLVGYLLKRIDNKKSWSNNLCLIFFHF